MKNGTAHFTGMDLPDEVWWQLPPTGVQAQFGLGVLGGK